MSESALIGGHLAHWRTFGSGPRPALALHCSLARARAWAALSEELGDRLTITALDLPGHGQSGDWDPGIPYLQQAMPMVETLAGAEPIDLIGHSFGAVLALAFAVNNPERIRSLILYEPVLFAAAERAERTEVEAHWRLMRRFGQALGSGDPEAAAQAFTEVWGAGANWDQTPRDQRDYIVKRIHLIEAGDPLLLDDAGGVLNPRALERLAKPVLFIRGSASPPVTGAIIESLASRISDVSCAVVDGAGHMGPITHPGDVAAVMRPFLDRT